jgi:hypothetical protein
MGLKILIFSFGTFIYYSSFSQISNFNNFDSCIPKISYQKKGNRSTKIKRTDKNQVAIGFFQDFSDTVKVYNGDSLIFNDFIRYDTSKVSTKYTGICFLYNFVSENSQLTVTYFYQKKYLRFNLNKNYPLYTIHVYRRNKCWVTGRKSSIIIK